MIVRVSKTRRAMVSAALLVTFLTGQLRPCEGQSRLSPALPENHPGPTPQQSTPAAVSEQWDQFALTPGMLHASPPLLGEKDIRQTFTRELIQVQWRAHDPIDLYVMRPPDVANPPVILFLYGYPSDTDRFRNDAYCESVVKNGFAAVGFVSALTGQRYHDRPMKEWFVSELPEALGTSVHDVQMILDYLAARHDLDMNRVGMYGQGSGGTVAILAAFADPRLTVVDVLDPWGDWPDWIAGSPQIPKDERPAFLSPDFLQRAAPFDPVQLLPRMKPGTFRLQQTLFSQITPGTSRNTIRAALPSSVLKIQYKDAAEYRDKVSEGGKVLDWLKTQLNSETSLSGIPPPEATQKNGKPLLGFRSNANPYLVKLTLILPAD